MKQKKRMVLAILILIQIIFFIGNICCSYAAPIFDTEQEEIIYFENQLKMNKILSIIQIILLLLQAFIFIMGFIIYFGKYNKLMKQKNELEESEVKSKAEDYKNRFIIILFTIFCILISIGIIELCKRFAS